MYSYTQTYFVYKNNDQLTNIAEPLLNHIIPSFQKQKINEMNNLSSLYFILNKNIFHKITFIIDYFKISINRFKHEIKETYYTILISI